MSSLSRSAVSLATLVYSAQNGNARAVEALIVRDGPLRRMVEAIKRDADPTKIARRWEPVPEKGKPDEAEAAARLGILEALKRFHPDRGASFTTFAYPFVKGEVLRALYPKVHRSSDEQPPPVLVDLELGAVSNEDSTSPGFETIMLKHDPGYGEETDYGRLIELDEHREVRQFVSELPENQRSVVYELFFAGRERKEVAAERGVSPQAVSKTLMKALSAGRLHLDPVKVAA